MKNEVQKKNRKTQLIATLNQTWLVNCLGGKLYDHPIFCANIQNTKYMKLEVKAALRTNKQTNERMNGQMNEGTNKQTNK